MNPATKWNIMKYFRSLKKKLPYIPKEKRKFTSLARKSLKSYLEEHPSATMDDIYAEFGTVEQLCEDYMGHMTQEQLMDGVRYIKKVNRYLLLLVFALFTLCVGYETYLYLNAPSGVHHVLAEDFLKFVNRIVEGVKS